MHSLPTVEYVRQPPGNSSPPNETAICKNGCNYNDDSTASGIFHSRGAQNSTPITTAASAKEQIHMLLNEPDYCQTRPDDTRTIVRPIDLGSQRHVSLETLPSEVLTHILSHLSPASLSTITSVSRQFHSLVTTPHAWRTAFCRYFPGPLNAENDRLNGSDHFVSDKQSFSRLTALASWRSEYILRTCLLRSLSRGKPASLEPAKRSGSVHSVGVHHSSAVATYTSQLTFPISHISGSFATETIKKQPQFVHGAAEQGAVSASVPLSIKVGSWGLSDFQQFRHFADLYPGEAEYGLGSGDMVGLPNQMDISQPYGMVYGEGCPQGRTYFISPAEQRGRFLSPHRSTSLPESGIPAPNMTNMAVCSVWIAKSPEILKMTGGLVGILSGSSSGVLTAYTLGSNPAYEQRFERGQVTVRWAICPGVPIIAIAVDDNYSADRRASGRIWIAVLNALGEVFYLTSLPCKPDSLPVGDEGDVQAWKTGRSVQWELVGPSRRVARPEPFARESVDGSYSPRSSSDSMSLSVSQIVTETREIERFLSLKPKYFRRTCENWDMKRELKVDFASDDGNGAGESLVVISSGSSEDKKSSIWRFTRKVVKPWIFASPSTGPSAIPNGSSESSVSGRRVSLLHAEPAVKETEWFLSSFSFGDRRAIQPTASALDLSTYALLTIDEDPLFQASDRLSLSSELPSSMPHVREPQSLLEIPGQRARYIAVGTATGTIFVWNIRSSTAQKPGIISFVSPLRVIQTDSPQVTCVALTSLYLVHGGNDGLVQAWDPLASTMRPIRTINSRFSSRARRRLIQAETSLHGVGSNFFAAGALCLDPDPTMLRGIVGLGTHLRYWAYSSANADQYRSSKRRRRRSKRNSNSSAEGQRFSNSGRGELQSQINEEVVEMERQEAVERRKMAHLSLRFGIDLLGPDASDEELIAYAQLLSEESYSRSVIKGGKSAFSLGKSASSNDVFEQNTGSLLHEIPPGRSSFHEDAKSDYSEDIAEAIRLSLLDVVAQPPEMQQLSTSDKEDDAVGGSRRQEMDDLELALQLSMLEEQNCGAAVECDFPTSDSSESPEEGKGKQRIL